MTQVLPGSSQPDVLPAPAPRESRRALRRARRRSPLPPAAPPQPIGTGVAFTGVVTAGWTCVAGATALTPVLGQQWAWTAPAAAAVVAALQAGLVLAAGLALVAGPGRMGRRLIRRPRPQGGSSISPIIVIGGIAFSGPLLCIAAVVALPQLFGWPAVGGVRWFGGAWRDIAASGLPLTPESRPVLALVVTSALATTLTVSAALVSRTRLLPLLPGLILLLIGSIVTTPPSWVPVLVVVSIAAHLLAGTPQLTGAPDRDRTSRHRGWQRRLLGLLLVAGCLAASLPFAHQFTRPPVRTTSPAPVQTPAERSALAWMAAWQNEEPRPVFTVSMDGRGSEPSGPLRWASLDTYDGDGWTSSAKYRLAGPTVRLAESASTSGSHLGATISDVRLPGPWLPSPVVPERVSGTGMLVDEATGDLATATRSPARYTVVGTRPGVGDQQLRTAHQRHRTAAEVSTGIPVPASIATAAEAATAGTATDVDRLAALEEWSRATLHYDPDALPGQSQRTLTEVVAGSRGATMDQVAAGYALLARSLGYPSRVVVGFTSPASTAAPSTPVTAHTVHTDDVVAWPEVWLDGPGWQPFYPVPLRGVRTDHDIVRQSAPQAAAPAPTVAHSERPRSGQQSGLDRTPARTASTVPTAAPVAALGLAATGSIVTGLVALFWWRRHRRRTAGTPAERIVRAWVSVQRNVSRRGESGVWAMSPTELVEAVTRRLGAERAEPARQLADLVSALLFGGSEPDEAQARRAWQLADDVRRAFRAGRPSRLGRPGRLSRPSRKGRPVRSSHRPARQENA